MTDPAVVLRSTLPDAPKRSAATGLATGAVMGGHVLLGLSSEGNFAEVWQAGRLAADGTPGPLVAVKVARSEVGARMLREEATLTRRLRYNTDRVPRVIGFHDAEADGATGPHTFLVTPWITGGTLRDLMREVGSADAQAHLLGFFVQVAEAVGQVHQLGVVHGDLKPENVLRDDEGAPVLLDFGLARQLRAMRLERSLRQSLKTEDDVVGGTLAYLPPEAVKGGEPTYQGDVYALGVMLHELLLGRRPDKATSPDTLRRLLPEAVVEVLLRALAFDPRDRYARAGDLWTDLVFATQTLQLTGWRRRGHALARFAKAGFAAFFVALRYASVAALVALYAWLLGVAVFGVSTGKPELAFVLLGTLPFLLLHAMVRWEGPETPAEVASRQPLLMWRRKKRGRG